MAESLTVYEPLRGKRGKRPIRQAFSAMTSWAADLSFQLYNHHGYGAYICGEETALLESLEGKKGMPRFKPPFPASYGLVREADHDQHTETFAAVPWIIRHVGMVPEPRIAEQWRDEDLLRRGGRRAGRANTRSASVLPFEKLLENGRRRARRTHVESG